MDAIAVLKRDHEEVERLFRQFEKLTERAHRSKQKIVMKNHPGARHPRGRRGDALLPGREDRGSEGQPAGPQGKPRIRSSSRSRSTTW